MNARFLTPLLLLAGFFPPYAIADEPTRDITALQEEMVRLHIQAEMAKAELRVRTNSVASGEKSKESTAQLDNRLASLNAQIASVKKQLEAAGGSGKCFRDLLRVGSWATLSEIRRGSELTGEYRVRLLTTEEKEKAQKQIAAYRERSEAHNIARQELELKRQKEPDRVRQAEIQRDLEALEQKYQQEGRSVSNDLFSGFHEIVEVGIDYVGFRRDDGKVLTYHRLSSIRTIVAGLE